LKSTKNSSVKFIESANCTNEKAKRSETKSSGPHSTITGKKTEKLPNMKIHTIANPPKRKTQNPNRNFPIPSLSTKPCPLNLKVPQSKTNHKRASHLMTWRKSAKQRKTFLNQMPESRWKKAMGFSSFLGQ
jgi:hypothetical protein